MLKASPFDQKGGISTVLIAIPDYMKPLGGIRADITAP